MKDSLSFEQFVLCFADSRRASWLTILYTETGKHIWNFTVSDDCLGLLVTGEQLSFYTIAQTTPLVFLPNWFTGLSVAHETSVSWKDWKEEELV